ncbi:hypothetical protein H2199_005723 [Coniosporium tulheliwenetii]|uniref:Uncharacterized protein n=1 Tax=Coniosporium tulheliwenetii TaxID=3383036 RepID=A0ACC2Z0I5_9PEZI|nr:hypothetical protein H2199_005723 [Cladosporium sp. JES 115]
MSSLLDILTQKQPQFETRQALLVLDLQNDFISPSGKLPVPTKPGFVDRIKGLAPIFRENAGDVIWVRTIYEAERPVNDFSEEGDVVITEAGVQPDNELEDSEDEPPAKETKPESTSRRRASRSTARALQLLKRVSSRQKLVERKPSPAPAEEDELFLSRTSKRGPCCLPNTDGADFAKGIKEIIDPSTDLVITKSHYSAFNGTTLLTKLRTKLITELYVCGCITNLSVYATALDAARYGLKFNLIDDCLGYRKPERHEEAMKQMVELMGARIARSSELLADLARPADSDHNMPESSRGTQSSDGLHDLIENLSLEDDHKQTRRDQLKTGVVSRSSPNVNSHKRYPDGEITRSSSDIRTTRRAEQQDQEVLEVDGSDQPSPVLPNFPTRRPPPPSENNQPSPKPKVRMRTRPDKSKQSGEPKGNSIPAEERKRSPLPKAGSKSTATRSDDSPPTTSMTGAQGDKTSNTTTQYRIQSPRPELRRPNSATEPTSARNTQRQTTSSTMALPTEETPPTPKARSADVLSFPAAISPSPNRLSPLWVRTTPSAKGTPTSSTTCSPSLLTRPSPSKPLSQAIFQHLYNEVHWQKMYHATGEVPRLVCVQGVFGPDGSMPVYRHPSDQSLPLLHFSPAVQIIREHVECHVGHPVNHVLIQLYRSGGDYISEHSDKTLDIVRGSKIVNVSFGAQRTMRLRTKKSASRKAGVGEEELAAARQVQRIPMPHNSMFVLGQETNMRWLHGISADKRLAAERSEAERAYEGMRISLTLRHIGTFLDCTSQRIWGQGATSKERRAAKAVVNGDEKKTEELIHAFGTENQSTEFEWEKVYGAGFDVLHFKKPIREAPMLFRCYSGVENKRLAIYTKESTSTTEWTVVDPRWRVHWAKARPLCFRDIDTHHTEVVGALPILLYLDKYHDAAEDDSRRAASPRIYQILLNSEELYRSVCTGGDPTSTLADLDDLVAETGYAAGASFSIADCALWPVLDEVKKKVEGGEFRKLETYLERHRSRWSE